MEDYTTGTGQKITVHDRQPRCQYGCVIHAPTDPHQEFPTHWRYDALLMERICPHGIGHPDRDAIRFIRETSGANAAESLALHGCDGCCDAPDDLVWGGRSSTVPDSAISPLGSVKLPGRKAP